MDVICGVIIPRDSEGHFLTEKKRYIKRHFPDEPETERIPECENEMLSEVAAVFAKKFSKDMKAYEKEPKPIKELSPDMKMIAKIYRRRQREIRREMERLKNQNQKGGSDRVF